MRCLANFQQYEDIYEGRGIVAILSGLFSPARFFIETMVVSDQRCLPPQTGFTMTKEATMLPLTSFDIVHEAQLDKQEVTIQSCNGWHWAMLPLFLVGLSVRGTSWALINIVQRNRQCKESFLTELRNDRRKKILAIIASLVLLLSYSVAVWAMLLR